jgi:hypothetical protein
MSLTDDGGLSSSSFGSSGSSSGSTSSGGNNVESSSNSSGDETVRHYTDASFGRNNEEQQQQHRNSRRSQHDEEEDVVSRRFSNAALGGEFDINNLSERTTRIISDVRRARWAREAAAKMKFSTGDELHELRSRIAGLRNELVDIKLSLLTNSGDTTLGRTESSTTDTNIDHHRKKANEIENEIAILNDRDAEFVYTMSSELKKRAVLNGDTDEINDYQCKMEDAMSCIPQMNLHGLWVGK